MKLMWKISHHPFPTTIEDSYYYSPQYTALQPKHPRSSVIPHTAESEVHQYPGCAPMNHTAPCSSRAHSPVPKEEGGFFSSISPRVTRLHLFVFVLLRHTVEIILGCVHKLKNFLSLYRATIYLLVGCVC